MQVDAVSIFTTYITSLEPVVTWVARNRVTQADTTVGFFDSAVAAEAGTTYRIKIYSPTGAGSLLATHDGVTSPWTYTTALQSADGLSDATAYARIFAVRDGVESLTQEAFLLRTALVSLLSEDGDDVYSESDEPIVAES